MIERRFSSERPTVATTPTARASKRGSVIVGYAAVFGRVAQIGPYFREVLERGASTDVIHGDTRAFFNHDASRLLGRIAAGTLRLSQDSRGLRYEIDANTDDPLAVSVVAQIGRGDIDGSSFAFTVDPDDERWTYESGKTEPLRTIYRIATLIDVSPVTFPAYGGTSSYIRAAAR